MELRKEKGVSQSYKTKKKKLIPNANTILMSLAILLLIAMIGLVLYFNDRYSVLSSQYSVEMSNLDRLNTDLERREAEINAVQAQLDETMRNLTTKEEREASLSGEYTSLEKQKGQLEGALSQTQGDFTQCVSDLGAAKTQLLEAQSDRDQFRQFYYSKLEELNKAYASIKQLGDKVDSLKACIKTYNLSAVCT